MNSAPLYGLVLAGGASKRMQRDKTSLVYHDRPQLELAFELLQQYCEAVWISVRKDQTGESGRARFPQIVDEPGVSGPLAGISAAQKAFPESAWLVLACDLPYVESGLFALLILHRDTRTAATAFRSAHDGLPEPLCAIWEPASAPLVEAWLAQDRHCPRRLLSAIDTTLLELPQGSALDNINTPAERDAALRALRNPSRKSG